MEHQILLAQSENYQIYHKFETVFLAGAKTNREVVIGDFYGEPNGAIIDKEERFAIIVGCGLTVYYLRKPFVEYKYEMQSAQWTELFREPRNVLWIESIVQKSHDVFEFTVDANAAESGAYQLSFPSMNVQKLESK